MSFRSPDRDGPVFGPVRPDRPQLVDGRLRFATATGLWFTVREELADDVAATPDVKGAHGRGSLVFESDAITYRVYHYPADWASRTAAELAELATESRPPAPASPRLAAPVADERGALTFVDHDGLAWRVREEDCGAERASGARRCLVFEAALFVRRVYEYPADWARLSSEALIALGSA